MNAIFLQLPQLKEITLTISERAVVRLNCPLLRSLEIVGHQLQGMSGRLAWLERILLLFLGRNFVSLCEIIPSPRLPKVRPPELSHYPSLS